VILLQLFHERLQSPLITFSATQEFHTEPAMAYPLHLRRIHQNRMGLSGNFQRKDKETSLHNSLKIANRNPAPTNGYIGGRRFASTFQPAISNIEDNGRSRKSSTLVPHEASLRKCVVHFRSYPLDE